MVLTGGILRNYVSFRSKVEVEFYAAGNGEGRLEEVARAHLSLNFQVNS